MSFVSVVPHLSMGIWADMWEGFGTCVDVASIY